MSGPLTATAADDGSFNVKLRDTRIPGSYTITATAPLGGKQAATSFTIADAGAYAAAVQDKLTRIVNVAGQALDVGKKGVDSLPESPAKTEYLKRTTSARQQ